MNRIVITSAAAAALAAAAIGLPSATARPAAPKSFTLVEHAGGLSFVDLPPVAASQTAPPSRGDLVAFTKRLTTPGGRKAGTLHAVCTVTKPGRSIEISVFQCDGTYALRRGGLTIATAGPIARGGRIALAVTGGTGAYAGAHGEVVSSESGETATDVFRLAR